MLTAALSFLPCITCLFWLVLNPLIRKADQESKTLELLLVVMALATVPDVWRVCGNDIAAVSIYLSKQFFAVITIPSILAYIRVQTPALSPNSSVQAWLAVPVALIFAQIILIMLIGPDDFISYIRDYPAFTAAGYSPDGKSDEQIAGEGLEAMKDWMKKIGVAMRLSEIGATEDMIDGITEATIILDGGYKVLTKDEIKQIVRESM